MEVTVKLPPKTIAEMVNNLKEDHENYYGQPHGYGSHPLSKAAENGLDPSLTANLPRDQETGQLIARKGWNAVSENSGFWQTSSGNVLAVTNGNTATYIGRRHGILTGGVDMSQGEIVPGSYKTTEPGWSPWATRDNAMEIKAELPPDIKTYPTEGFNTLATALSAAKGENKRLDEPVLTESQLLTQQAKIASKVPEEWQQQDSNAVNNWARYGKENAYKKFGEEMHRIEVGLAFVKDDPLFITKLTPSLQKDPAILAEVIPKLVEKINNIDRESIEQGARPAWLLEKVTKEVRESEPVVNATINKQQEVLDSYKGRDYSAAGAIASAYKDLPEEIKRNPQILSMHGEGVKEAIGHNSAEVLEYREFDKNLKDYPGLEEVALKAVVDLREKNPGTYGYERFDERLQSQFNDPVINVRDQINLLISGHQDYPDRGVSEGYVARVINETPSGQSAAFIHGNNDEDVLKIQPHFLKEMENDGNFVSKMKENLVENLRSHFNDPSLRVSDSGNFQMSNSLTPALEGNSQSNSTIWVESDKTPTYLLEINGNTLSKLTEKIRSPEEVSATLSGTEIKFLRDIVSGQQDLVRGSRREGDPVATRRVRKNPVDAPDFDYVQVPEGNEVAKILSSLEDRGIGVSPAQSAALAGIWEENSKQNPALSQGDLISLPAKNLNTGENIELHISAKALHTLTTEHPWQTQDQKTLIIEKDSKQITLTDTKDLASQANSVKEEITPAAKIYSALQDKGIGVSSDQAAKLAQIGQNPAGHGDKLIALNAEDLHKGGSIELRVSPQALSSILSGGEIKAERADGTITLADAKEITREPANDNAKLAAPAKPEQVNVAEHVRASGRGM